MDDDVGQNDDVGLLQTYRYGLSQVSHLPSSSLIISNKVDRQK